MSMRISYCLLPVAALAGCVSPPPLAVEVQRGVPTSQFALRITESSLPLADHPIEVIALNASPGGGRNPGSSGTVIWAAAHIKGQPYLRPPVTLRFGSPVPGYTSSAVPPLVLGRYEARVSAGGVSALTRFRVTEQNIIE
jgi:hypothetical protein